MNAAPFEWKSFVPACGRAWNAFFDTAVDLRTIGFLRIFYAAIILINLLAWLPDPTLYFGERGLAPYTIAHELQTPYSLNVFESLPTSDYVIWACWTVFLAQTLALLAGVYPRVNAVGVFLWLCSFQHRNPLIWDGEDVVMRLIGFWMIFLPLHLVGCRDFFLRPITPANDAPQQVSAWGVRMIQLQMCLIYLDTAGSKLHGQAWQNGTAVYYPARLDEFARLTWVPDFPFDTPWVVAFLTWSVLVIEIVCPLLLWFGETRRPALLFIFLFHMACNLTMHLFLFHWIMACGWCAFLTTEDWQALGRGYSRMLQRLQPLLTRLPFHPFQTAKTFLRPWSKRMS